MRSQLLTLVLVALLTSSTGLATQAPDRPADELRATGKDMHFDVAYDPERDRELLAPDGRVLPRARTS